jgi:hypothetical protein
MTLICSDGPEAGDESVELTDARIREALFDFVPRSIPAEYVACGREYSNVLVPERLC